MGEKTRRKPDGEERRRLSLHAGEQLFCAVPVSGPWREGGGRKNFTPPFPTHKACRGEKQPGGGRKGGKVCIKKSSFPRLPLPACLF